MGVPFSGLKEIKITTTKIQHKNQQCVYYNHMILLITLVAMPTR